MNRYFILFLFLISTLVVSAQLNDRFSVINVDANTANNEFGTILTNDGSVYYSKSTFKNSTNFNEKGAKLYKGNLEPKGQISAGLKFPVDATHAVFTKDGNVVYFSKRNGNNNFQLYKAKLDRTGRWKNIIRLPFNDPQFSFKQPALNNDNTKLFFATNLSSGNNTNDIYYVDILNNGLEYGKPVKLGNNVNTSANEMYPFLGQDDKLFFSSDRREGGLGGLDIYESFLEDGIYTKTSNLDTPINSPADDFAYVTIPGENKGYFSSNRVDGFGGTDIYYFEDAKPSLNKCSQAIEGIVREKINKKPIFEVTIEIFNTVDNIGTMLTDYKGEFVIDNVECSEPYDLVFYKEGYNFTEVTTIPEEGKRLFIYLDSEFPEEFAEEYETTNEITVIDTETNEVIKPEEILDTDFDEGISFAEKRERDRIIKERIKKEQIQKELEAERIAKEKKKQELLAQAEAQRLQVDKEKQERLEQAKALADKLRSEQERARKEEAERIENERLAALEIQEKQREANRIAEQEAEKQRLKALEIAAALKKEEARKKEEEQALALEEQKRIEKQKAFEALKSAEEQKRKERIAKAQEIADKIRKEQELKEIEDAKKAEELRIAQLEKQKQEEIEAKQAAIEKERQEKIAKAQEIADKIRREQELKEIEDAKKAEELRIAQLEKQKQEEIEAKQAAIEKERQEKIAKAQEIADKIRREQELKEIEDAKKAEELRIAQLEKQKQEEIEAKQAAIEKERQEKIAKAQEIADKIRREQELKEIEEAKKAEELRIAQLEKQASLNNDNLTESGRCARNIHGIIQNSRDHTGLENANVDMYYDGQNIESTTTDANGEFHFYNVDCNTTYTLISFKKDFNNLAKAVIDTETVPDVVVLLLEPDPIVVETPVVEEFVEETENNTETITSDDNQEVTPNTEETTTPEEITQEEITQEENIEEIKSPEDAVVVAIEPEDEGQEVEKVEIKEGKILLNPIYFDLDEYYLTLPARRELDKIIVIMRKYPEMVIESGSHTDTRGNFDYNLELSEKRSQEVVGYLVANGADPDRISGRGYGETMPVNECIDGVKCSEKKHLENRRTEFIILKY